MKSHLLVLIIAMIPSLVWAQDKRSSDDRPEQRPKHGRFWKDQDHNSRPDRWFKKLDLSEEQKTKMQELRQQKENRAKTLHDELRAKHSEMMTILAGSDPVDKAQIVHKRIQEIRTELGNIHFESIMAIREILTPAQRAKFVEHMSERGGPGRGRPFDEP